MSLAGDRQKQKYGPWLLAILLGSQLVLMAVTSRKFSGPDGSEQSMLRSWTMTVVTPIQTAIGYVTDSVAGVWSGYFDLRGVREHNAELEAQNAALLAEIEAARAAAAENDRLREVLGLRPLLKYDSIVAEVVARDSTAWFKRIVVNKGSQDGIRFNMPVVTADGLVGRVTQVGPFVCQIQLISDEHAGVGGRLTSSRAVGEVEGRGDGTCRLKSISSLYDVTENEPILTSGLDRLYPAGILIGRVTSVAKGAGATPQDIAVRPSADLDRVEVVMILLVAQQDLAMPDTVK
jgi:rod shape-determining protein MreC